MRIFLFFLITPFLIFSQEFYPGSLSQVDAPICYNTGTTLTFESLPFGSDSDNYSYQWQISWNSSNWFNINNETSTSYVTETLSSDTYYRVMITSQDITLSTNTIAVYVLPPLESGILTQIDSLCVVNPATLFFEVAPSGAEWSWGGFSQFMYEWQQGNIIDVNMGTPSLVDWLPVGNNTNTYTPDLIEEGFYYFRCIVTSLYGCGTIATDPIFVEVVNCYDSSIEENTIEKEPMKVINILGQNNQEKSLIINIYNDGFVEKKYIIK